MSTTSLNENAVEDLLAQHREQQAARGGDEYARLVIQLAKGQGITADEMQALTPDVAALAELAIRAASGENVDPAELAALSRSPEQLRDDVEHVKMRLVRMEQRRQFLEKAADVKPLKARVKDLIQRRDAELKAIRDKYDPQIVDAQDDVEVATVSRRSAKNELEFLRSTCRHPSLQPEPLRRRRREIENQIHATQGQVNQAQGVGRRLPIGHHLYERLDELKQQLEVIDKEMELLYGERGESEF